MVGAQEYAVSLDPLQKSSRQYSSDPYISTIAAA